MFHTHHLSLNNLFINLSTDTKFERITHGRQGAVLVDSLDNIPLLRTTTTYKYPAQKFTQLHEQIMKEINKIDTSYRFNNALIEIYDENYKTMGYHTDQSLDMAENSYICLFSCYNDTIASRKLDIINKDTQNETYITLEHNSIVVFSHNTNLHHQHRIVSIPNISNQWLGITFRLSKTFIKFINEIAYFNNQYLTPIQILTLATEKEQKEFFKYKKLENNQINFTYPELTYTISPSDLLKPVDTYNHLHSY